MTNIIKDFNSFARSEGISSLKMDYHQKFQNSLTPMILETSEMRVTQMSVFDRLMMDRVIWIAGTVNDYMSTIVQAQLMFLDNDSNTDITMHIDTGGGSVKSGLSIVDVMNYITSDITTINTGIAASMGSILLGAGTKTKRHTLNFSKVMLHQVSSGMDGSLIDLQISLSQAKMYNDILFELLGEYTNKDPEQVKLDANRDYWLTSKEALDYGIVDSIIHKKKK